MEKIIERVKKLLTMAEQGTENERKVAMLQVQKLVLKHHLDLNEIVQESKPKSIVSRRAGVGFNAKQIWVSDLANVIADNFRCVRYFIGYNKIQTIKFMGEELDVNIACNVFEFALSDAKRNADKLVNNYYRNYGTSKGIRASYYSGYVSGLRQAYYEQVQQNQEFGLVLVKPKEAIDYKASLKAATWNYIGKIGIYHSDIANKGYKDGYQLGKPKRIKRFQEELELE